MNYAIILAAGQGQRMADSKDKLLLTVSSKPLIYFSLMAYNDHSEIDEIYLVANKLNKGEFEKILKTYNFKKVKKILPGGLTRQESVNKAASEILKKAKDKDIIITHNGANPLPSAQEIFQTIERAAQIGACITGHYITSTVKEIDDRHIIKTHDRNRLFAAETPQAATARIFKKALKNAEKTKLQATDEAMLFEAIGQEVAYVEAHEDNFKITNQNDFARLRGILGDLPEGFRIGIGQDSHEFEELASVSSLKEVHPIGKSGRMAPSKTEPKTYSPCLVLAGVQIPDLPKLKANSDGDVILHAIFNAISQAIGDKSLGFYADPMCEKGVKDSKKYLETILKKAHQQGCKINSLGLMIEAMKPKIDPLVPQFKKSLSKILDLDPRRIGITATSGENLTSFGRGAGIQCFAIVSLLQNTSKKTSPRTPRRRTN